jgi:hypothetical protein
MMKAIFAGSAAALLFCFSCFSAAAEPADKPQTGTGAATASAPKADNPSSSRRKGSRNADARKCLELQDNRQVARCAHPYL